MPPKSDLKHLDFYRKKLRRARNPVVCRRCEASVLPKFLEKHFYLFHNFNPKLGCVWCERISWNSSEKHANGRHLLACFAKYYEPSRLLAPTPLHKSLLILLHLFPEKDHFGAIPLAIHTLYELIWPQLVEVKALFQDHNLNLAAAYLSNFFELQDTHEWFHVMVKAVAMERFIEAMDADKGETRTLLFSCWCDGGPYEDPMVRHHRHMIVVSPAGRFEKHVWKAVALCEKDVPCRSYPCKGMKRIESPMHLVNTLGYVSSQKSRCESEAPCKRPDKLYHFYLYKTLPVDFKLPLALLWDGGLQQLLYERKFQSVSVSRLIEKPLVRVGGRWKQKMKDFYGHERGLVVPVAKGLMPTRERPWEAACTFHLLEGEKLYFEYSRENETLDEETWMRRQAEGGNCFYDVVEEALWTMRPRDQRTLNILMPFVTENRQLKSENARLEERYEAVGRQLDRMEGRHKEDRATMQRRYEKKVATMRRSCDKEIGRIKDSTKKKMSRMKEKYECQKKVV